MDIFIHIKLNKSFNDNDTQVLSNKGFPISDKIKKKSSFGTESLLMLGILSDRHRQTFDYVI